MKLIPVYDRGGVTAWTTVDDADFDFLSRFHWTRCGTAPRYYAQAFVGGRYITMHRLLMGLESGDKRQVDHEDRDRMNNQRDNLRVCTGAQNRQNTSCRKGRYRGVSWAAAKGKWRATVGLDGRQHFAGYHDDEDAAGRAAAALRARLYTHSTD